MSGFPPIAELLPHAGRAVLLDAVLANGADSITALALIDAAHPWFVPGRGVPVWVGMEMMAQAAAAHGSLNARARGLGPRRGMLLGTRDYRGTLAWFSAGMRLQVHAARALGDSGGMSACDCRIEHEGHVLATATLIIFEEEAA